MSSLANYDILLAHIQKLEIEVFDFVDRLRPFTLEDEIGHGTAMTVYESRFREPPLLFPEKVALKVPNQDIKGDSTDEDEVIGGVLTAICQEIQMIKMNIYHPYIIILAGVTFQDLKPILVVELAKAGLSDYLVSRMAAGNRVKWETKARFCYEISEGISALHYFDMVLGNIKAENFLLFGDSEEESRLTCKLSDCGYSSTVALIFNGKERETSKFMAPECTPMAPLEMKAYANESTKDNYSYGLCVWHVAMDGKVPYEDMNIEDIDETKHSDKQLLKLMNQLPEDTPESFKTIIVGMTQYEPTKRKDLINVGGILSDFSNINFRAIDGYIKTIETLKANLTQDMKSINLKSFQSAPIPSSVKKRLFRMYEVAASKGDAEAAYYLSVCYMLEFGVNFDKTKMVSCAIQAAKGGNLEAVKSIIRYYVNSIDLFPDNLSQLFPWITQTAEDGHKESQVFIAMYYKDGLYVEKNVFKQRERQKKYSKSKPCDYIGMFLEESPLHYAARVGNKEAIKFFVQQEGMDVNAKNTSGITPLYLATSNHHTKVINVLVDEFGADVNIKDINGWTPVHIAADSGNTTNLSILVRKFGAVANMRSNYGITPLHLATRSRRYGTSRLLASEYGVDINAKEDNGWTSLHIAAEKGYINIVNLLVAGFSADVNVKNNTGQTPLHLAVGNGHADIVRFLVQYEADVNSKTNDGWTPLHLAARNGHINMVELFVGADVNIQVNVGLGADINARTDHGWTPLHMAAQNGHIDIVKLFVTEFGVDVDIRSDSGWTPLHSAAKYGRVDTVKLLVDELEADINARNCNNLTPLICSGGKRCEDVALALSEHPRANNYAKTDDGQTLLHLAVRYRREIAIKILVEQFHLDIHAKDSKGQTSLDLADDSSAHLGIYCDGCEKSPIIGERYKCTVCVDFDFCSVCYSSVDHFNHEHIFRIVKLPSVKYLLSP